MWFKQINSLNKLELHCLTYELTTLLPIEFLTPYNMQISSNIWFTKWVIKLHTHIIQTEVGHMTSQLTNNRNPDINEPA